VVAPEDAVARSRLAVSYTDWPHFAANVGFKSKPEFQFHSEPLNPCQHLLFRSGILVFLRLYINVFVAKDKEKGLNPIRIGRFYSDHFGELLRRARGDQSDLDLMGIRWRFNTLVEGNRLDPNVETWSEEHVKSVEHVMNSVLHSMDPSSAFFRRDLIK